LFGEATEPSPGPFDRQFRTACGFYNRGLAKALKDEMSDAVGLTSRELYLPMGTVSAVATRSGFRSREARYFKFITADEYEVRGLEPRERASGLGVTLIGVPDGAAFG